MCGGIPPRLRTGHRPARHCCRAGRCHAGWPLISRVLLALAAGVALALTIARVVVFWANQAYLDTVSGIWTALAVDLASGVFYRPMSGPDGLGGTRYFPLHVVIHAAVIRVVGDPIRAGQIVAALSVILLCAGVYAVVRSLRGSPLLAGASGLAMLSSQTTQEALLSIRGDALPAALNLLGAALVFRAGATARHATGAAILFSLAFAAKPTAVYGLLAAVIWLALASQSRRAITLVAMTVAGSVLLLGAAGVASGGRVLSLWWTGASSGVNLGALLRAPLTFAQLARQVPETLVFIQLGLAAIVGVALRARTISHPATVLLLATLATTVPIFGLEGTDTNHLIDVLAVSIVALAAFIAIPASVESDFATAALAVATLAASLSLGTGLMNHAAEQRHGTFAQALALVPDHTKPILSENPLVAIAAGQRPYVLDSYMLRLFRERDPSFADPLWQKLQSQEFSAVVIERNPHDERGQAWYRSAFFGDGFIDRLEASYERAGDVGMRIVYLPRRR